MASEKMVALRRSLSSEGLVWVNCSVAADSMALPTQVSDNIRNKPDLRGTYNSGPDTAYRHLPPPLPLKIHSKPLGQHTHAHLPHRIRRLAPEEAAVDGRTDDDDPAILGEMRQRCLQCCVEAFGVDALHELEALEWCG